MWISAIGVLASVFMIFLGGYAIGYNEGREDERGTELARRRHPATRRARS
jgi:hypothetical protein